MLIQVMFSQHTTKSVADVCCSYVEAHPTLQQQLYKTVQETRIDLVDKSCEQYYGGQSVLNDEKRMTMIMDMLNLTTIVNDMMGRNDPPYALRKWIDVERERLWNEISDQTCMDINVIQ